jgi:hypothetical protein
LEICPKIFIQQELHELSLVVLPLFLSSFFVFAFNQRAEELLIIVEFLDVGEDIVSDEE